MLLSRQQRFPRSRFSVPAARTFAVNTATEWGATDRLDDVRLCVSELATNALLHGVPPGREFCVRLTTDGEVLRIEVRDSGDGRPSAQAPCADQITGRGLHIVRELADDCGVVEHVVGKTVWLAIKTASVSEGAR
ncbi:ATP-binding protein [Streptomyces sp. P9(2023)]|uniref:ATP-binding protein n=1 Tax=Streptomyces sp. P9(2023) TaxID=3064394 RepID=UPI0028F40050|nr:ATP-binding protein [Streptomyces sp. P9(2023)]MDT9688810.1 ATP-binding protein [Streptomyces sp. P9(2023)]